MAHQRSGIAMVQAGVSPVSEDTTTIGIDVWPGKRSSTLGNIVSDNEHEEMSTMSTSHKMLEVVVDLSSESVSIASIMPTSINRAVDRSATPMSVTESDSTREPLPDLPFERPPASSWRRGSYSFRDSLPRSASRVINQWFSRDDAAAKSLPQHGIRKRHLVSTSSRGHRGRMDTMLFRSTSTDAARLAKAASKHALEGLQVISKVTATADQKTLWAAVEERFKMLADADSMLPRSSFAECIGMKDSKEFATELFDAAVRRKGRLPSNMQKVSKEDLYEYWLQITDKSFDSRIQIFFDLCDKDLDGRITKEEVKEVITLSASTNKLSKLKEQAHEFAELIMEELDVNDTGYIEISQLETLMQGVASAGGLEADYKDTILQARPAESFMHMLVRKSHYFLSDNWMSFFILFLWIAAMISLFVWTFVRNRRRTAFLPLGYCVCVAKAAVETLKLNMALILLPMCRISLTWARSTWLSKYIPFDSNIKFHKVIAVAIVLGIFLHAGLHVTCDFPKLVNANHTLFENTIGADFYGHQPSYAEVYSTPVAITGIIMVVLMAFSMTLATDWFRKNLVMLPGPLNRLTGFNAFWYSHHLLAIVYVLLIVHGQYLLLDHNWRHETTWMYLAAPVLLYSIERIFRILRSGHLHKVDVVKASIHPGNVLAIHMTKPQGFYYKSGMYMFLRCSQISSFEWHPFSITSAPGDPFLSVHIRAVGDWTKELKRIFSEANVGKVQVQTVNNVKVTGELSLAPRFPRLSIDAPYGAPAQDYMKYDILLLVGLGIGATPFVSIMKDMLNQIRINEQLEAVSTQNNPFQEGFPKKKKIKAPSATRSALFYWVTREQGSFDWFRGVMEEVEESDTKGVIEMHNYLTSIYEEGDARSSLITMLQALHHAKNGLDLVSGTRARTHFGRPNWKSVFSKLAETQKDMTVGIFYCGPPVLAKELKSLSQAYTENSSTKFEFHKENF